MRKQLRVTSYELLVTKPSILSFIIVFLWLALAQGVCLGAEYYVDPVNGNDSFDGMAPVWDGVHGPWQTIGQAQSVAGGGDAVFLASGYYGDFIDDNARTDWLDWVSTNDKKAVFRRIIIGASTAGSYNAYLRFYNMKVDADQSIGQNTPMVLVDYANNVEFYDNEWYGHERYDGVAPSISGDNFRIEGTEIHYGTSYGPSPLDPGYKSRGINIFAGQDFLIKDCDIYHMSSTGIYLAPGTSGTIDGCHIHNQEPLWPGFDGTAEAKHGSGIGIATSDVIIRNNVIHSCGASGGHIFFYTEPHHNITIENNLLYDGKGFGTQSTSSWGRNGKFNNNIVVTNWQSLTPSTSEQRYAMGVSFIFDNYQNDFEFYNNIIIAYMQTDGTDISQQSDNNIVYSFKPTLGWIGDPLWVNTGLGPNSVILNSDLPGYGWMWKDTLEGGGWDPEQDFFVSPVFDVWIDNSVLTWSGNIGDFNIKDSSPAIGFADGLLSTGGHAPVTDLLGVSRDSSPDAGCYEYITSTFIYGDVNGNGEVTSYDAALAARYAVGLETFTDEQRQRADVSGNGAVSAYDAALIAQKAVGLIDKFPVEQ